MAVDRLSVAAVLGGLRQRSWSLLTVCAFGVLAAAGAAAPMFAEASDNAAFQVRRDEIPETARQNDAAVVRLSANVGPASFDQQSVLADLRAVPGLTEPDLTGGSIGAELSTGKVWRSTVSIGDRQERARLFAVGTPATELVPVGGPPRPDGLWLPQPVADGLGARPGDPLVLSVVVGNRGTPRRATTTVAGVYAVDASGRLPADPPGGRKWALRTGDTPGDTEYETLPSYLVVGNVTTVERLARAVGDKIFWSVEAALAPGVTLAQAGRTADDVEELRRRYATDLPAEGDDPLALRFASGIGRIVAAARATTETVRQRTRPVQWAATAVGLASVLAVGLLSARRREREVRHQVAVGIAPLRVGGLWLLEHLLPSLVGVVLGGLVAWVLVTRSGPPGAIRESLPSAAWTAAAATTAGLVVVAVIGALTAALRVRPAPPATARRALPWTTMLIVVAGIAVAGLMGSGGAAGGLDLLVPLLVLAAIGAAAGWLPSRLALTAGLPATPRRAVWWLARRRLGAGGGERRLTVLVVTAGLGMLLFALSAVGSTAASADDRIAVVAGAAGVATLQGSWELDPSAPVAPAEPTDDRVPGARNPPLPPGNAVVWLTDVTTPLDDDQKDLLAVDPARFGDVALWGSGADLATAREAVRALATRPATADGTPRAIAVGDPASARVDSIRATLGGVTEDLAVAARVPAFPGMRGRPMYVVAADALFGRLGGDDPRLTPRNRQPGALFVRTFLWSAGGAAGVRAVTAPLAVTPERVDTAAQLRQEAGYIAAGRARGYQLAIAGYLALLAVLTLGIYAQRTAVLRRPADLMLARVGLGRGRIAAARAVEFVLVAAVALAAAVAGVAALAPLGGRLLDDQPGLLPRFAFQLSGAGATVTAGVAVLAAAVAVAASRTGSAGSEEDAYRDD